MKVVWKLTAALIFLSVSNGISVLRTKDFNGTNSLLLSDDEQLAQECDCGVYGACHLENGRKKCTCTRLTHELDGKCVECGCGEHTYDCYFKGDGTNICTCDFKFIYVNGQCRECYCGGSDGVCIFDLGRKKCICSPNYIEKDGLCIANEKNTTVASTSSSLMTMIFTSTVTNTTEKQKETSFDTTIIGDDESPETTPYELRRSTVTTEQTECDCGVNGECSLETGIKRCTCDWNYAEKNGKCEYCNCGEYSKYCRYDWKGNRKCDCIPGYVENNGRCKECDCGRNGNCTFKYGQKKCFCNSLTSEKDGYCVECDCGRNGNCKFKYGQKKCSCNLLTSEKDGYCVECNCGVNARSCFFSVDGSKICRCDFGYIQTNGYCEAICNEDKCLHGKCEIAGNGFKCRCNEGFTGQRCEEKVQTKSRKQDLWMLLQLSVVFAIFILLSGMFCFWTRILNKMSKK